MSGWEGRRGVGGSMSRVQTAAALSVCRAPPSCRSIPCYGACGDPLAPCRPPDPTSLPCWIALARRYGLSELELQEVEEQLQELAAARQPQPGAAAAAAAAAGAARDRAQRDAELLGARLLLSPPMAGLLLVLPPAVVPGEQLASLLLIQACSCPAPMQAAILPA